MKNSHPRRPAQVACSDLKSNPITGAVFIPGGAAVRSSLAIVIYKIVVQSIREGVFLETLFCVLWLGLRYAIKIPYAICYGAVSILVHLFKRL